MLVALCACGGGAAGPTGTGPTGGGPVKPDDKAGPPPHAERTLVAPIGDEPSVDCADKSTNPPEWREPPPPDKGYVRVDAVAFRSGCLSASLLDENIADREPALVSCFDNQRIKDATIVMRTTWSASGSAAALSRIEMRAAPGATLPANSKPLGTCLQSALTNINDLGPEPTLPAVVDVLLRRGFPEEIETLGVD